MKIRWLILLLLLGLHAPSLNGATPAETRALKAAIDMFQDKLYSTAETNFIKFLAMFPNSEHRAEALLYEAKAKFHQKNFTEAIGILEEHLPQAGPLLDQYLFCLGETFFESGKFQQAAEKYAELAQTVPSSTMLLQASFNQALAMSKLGNWATVIKLLQDPTGSFQRAAQAKTNEAATIDGFLLLGEALLKDNKFSETEKVVQALDQRTLAPDAKWRQQHLLCRAQVGSGQLTRALLTSSNLVETAPHTTQPQLEATSIDLQATILEDLKLLPGAIAVHERNLVETVPSDVRRHALFKIIELTLAQNKMADAMSRLESFVEQNTNDTTLDLALFTLGELRLKQFYSEPPTTANAANVSHTNLITAALTNFDRVITNFPQSALLGKTYLNRGWCFWAADKLDLAKTNFTEALMRLAHSEEKAIAHFKLADVQFRVGDFTGALSNYTAVIRDFADLPSVKATLFDQTLYQIVRASLAVRNYETAKDAMAKILEWYPNTGFAERARLLVGQELNRKGSFQEARELFWEFIAKAPDSPLLPQVKLALAQTYVQEQKWTNAIEQFEQWSATFTNHALLAHAQFSRALATYQAGMETNALVLFTNFVREFPSNNLASVAQNWIGDFYFNRQEFILAELNYAVVEKYSPTLELACQSRLAASRAAFHRQGFKDARDHLNLLINNTNTPTDFLVEAFFALGDTIYSQFLEDTNRVDDFRQAIAAFSRITTDHSDHTLAPSAWGRIGECYLQSAGISKDPAALDLATNAFSQIGHMDQADNATRNHAEVGLGKVFEVRGDLDGALGHYAAVIYDDETGPREPRWLKEAGLAAAKICESREQWEQALSIYRRLLNALPSLKPSIEKKMAIASSQLASARK